MANMRSNKDRHLKVGLKVYHKIINQNLIVASISSDRVTCIDARDTGNLSFGTLVADESDLEVGWKSPTELKLDRMKRMVGK